MATASVAASARAAPRAVAPARLARSATATRALATSRPVRGLGLGVSAGARAGSRRVSPRASSDGSSASPTTKSSDEEVMFDSTALPENFCIIEAGNPGAGKVRDFADLDSAELMNNIESRKNRIFIMLEEVRRLRVQAQLRTRSADELPPPPAREYPSVVPGFPRITENTFNDYYIYWGGCVAFMLLFGGLIAPLAEVKLGLGGTTYMDFIESVHLPRQLAMVDPIVASFTGGAVGAISAFFVIEIQNFKEQEKKLCMYCKGSGYLQCAECCTSPSPGRLIDPVSNTRCFCGTCSGTAKVMCSSCLATGREIVTEHDRRIDPFD
jgi:hypothetical protein